MKVAEPIETRTAGQDFSGRLLFKPALLGGGILFAVFLNTVRFFPDTVLPLEDDMLFSFVNGMSLGALILGSLCVLVASQANSTALNRVAQLPVWTRILLGVCLTAIGMMILFPLGGIGSQPALDPGILGFLFGVGMLTLILEWGTIFASYDPEIVLFNTACSLVLAGCLHFAGEWIVLSATYAVYLYILLALSALLLWFELTKKDASAFGTPEQQSLDRRTSQGARDTKQNISVQSDTKSAADSPAPPLSQTLRTAARLLWMPLVGACLSCFIFGLTWDSVVSGEEMHNADLLNAWKVVLGPLLAMLPLALLVVKRPDSSALRLLNHAVYPIAVALLLALPFVLTENGGFNAFIELLTPASFSIITLAVWCNMANTVRSASISAAVLFAGCIALFALSFFTGIHLIYVIGTDGRTICLVLLTLYLALIAVSFALDTRAEKAGRADSSAEGSSKNYISRICDTLAAQYDLSPREHEVLYYLGRGYNHGYTATKLYISENTVRTHVRHIYEKLGIESREELLALIDSMDRA